VRRCDLDRVCRAGSTRSSDPDAHTAANVDAQIFRDRDASPDHAGLDRRAIERDDTVLDCITDNVVNAGSEQHVGTIPNSIRNAAGTGRLRGDLATGLLRADE
jgi:hypothetical protein